MNSDFVLWKMKLSVVNIGMCGQKKKTVSSISSSQQSCQVTVINTSRNDGNVDVFFFFFYTFKCQRLNFRLRKYSFHDTEACRISFPFPARRFLWWVIRTWLHCMYAARGSSCRCVMFSSRKMQQHYEWRACALRHVAPPPAHYFQTDVHYSLHIIPQIIFTQEAIASDSFMLNYNFNYNFIITIKLTFLENSQKLINKE